MLLYKRQKRMKWLEAIMTDPQFDEKLLKELDFDSVVGSVDRLGLYPDARGTLEFSHQLIRRTKRLEKLTIHANFENASPPIPSRDLNDAATAPGLITSTIFGHMMPFDKCVPLVLKELTLQKVHLRYAADTYCRVIDFSRLEALRIFECSGTDALLAELSKSAKLPTKLHTLEIKADDDQQEGEVLSSLDGFLCLVSGIAKLTIDLAYAKEMPSPASITRHAKTLTSLSVHANENDATDSDEDDYTFDGDGIEKICKQCKSLEQISLSFPESNIVRATSSEYDHFGSVLKTLPKLITLNITTWPSNMSTTTGRLSRKLYEHILQGVAQNIFDSFGEEASKEKRRSELSVIAFGTSDKIYEREDSKTTIIYIKGRQVGPFGREAALAVPVGWRLRKYIEPKSDVLDFALSRTVKPPVKDNGTGDDGELSDLSIYFVLGGRIDRRLS